MARRLINVNLMVLAAIGILLLSDTNKSVVAGACDEDLLDLITKCASCIAKSAEPKAEPSQECCKVVKNIDTSCVCQHMTKEMLQVLDMHKVLFVAQRCGKPIPSGTNCEGIIVP